MLNVLTDILLDFVAGDSSVLVLLDKSTAFDMVDHEILLRRVVTSSYSFRGTMLQWFKDVRS